MGRYKKYISIVIVIGDPAKVIIKRIFKQEQLIRGMIWKAWEKKSLKIKREKYSHIKVF